MLAFVENVIEGYGKGVKVEAIGVVDEERIVEGFVHFETHGHGCEVEAAAGNGSRVVTKVTQEGDAVKGVFN